jgi:hypothetical protein
MLSVQKADINVNIFLAEQAHESTTLSFSSVFVTHIRPASLFPPQHGTPFERAALSRPPEIGHTLLAIKTRLCIPEFIIFSSLTPAKITSEICSHTTLRSCSVHDLDGRIFVQFFLIAY